MLSKLLTRVRTYTTQRGAFDSCFFLSQSVLQLFRGLLRGYWLVFLGRSVVIRARSRVSIGKFTRIEDYVELDGFGSEGIQIGAFCKIGKFSVLRVPSVPYLPGEGIIIGDNTTLAEYCFVGGAARVVIGARNAIGQYVSIHPQNHLPNSGEEEIRTSSRGIRIGNDNWVGAKATALDGSSIGDRAIVAAASLVRSEFGSDVLVAGVPAIAKRSLKQ
jgi:acetyltransferase-like isoleucine patch superfamily enzyme